MQFFLYFMILYCILCLAVIAYGMATADDSCEKKPLAEILYVTASNLRGHQSLYKNGWFVVSSSKKAIRYAKEHSLTRSKLALSRTIDNMLKHSARYARNLRHAARSSVQLGKDIYAGGTRLSRKTWSFTQKLLSRERRTGARSRKLAWQRFIKGNLTLRKRSAADRAAFAAIPGLWYTSIRSDFKGFRTLTRIAKTRWSFHTAGGWALAFDTAKKHFNHAYEKSGGCANSIAGLGYVMIGYGKSLYTGLIAPSARALIQGTVVIIKSISKLIILPFALAVIISGRTVQFCGIALYRIFSMAVKTVSPTIESGLLATLSVLSYVAMPLTAATGVLAAAMIRIVAVLVSPLACVFAMVLSGAIGTGVYAARMGYSLMKGVVKITVNQALGLSVLAYNSVTALTTQLLLGSANMVVFLAYDTPRLAVASVKGEVAWPRKKWRANQPS